MKSFINRQLSKVIGILSGFDRVRLRGTLRQIVHPRGMLQFLSYKRVLLKDFGDYAEQNTKFICQQVKQNTEAAGQEIIYLKSCSVSKEKIVRELMQENNIDSGLVCVFSCVEPGYSFRVVPNSVTKKCELKYQRRPCKHYYHYWNDPQLGLVSFRLQTWFPYTVHVCLNGREWLARQMDEAGLGYVRRENCFTDLEDPVAAQQLMDQQLRVNWTSIMNRLTKQSHPAHRELFGTLPQAYTWSIDQSEWATDIMFREPELLAQLYPRLIRHGMTTFSSPEVMRFLGYRTPAHGGVNGNFLGEVTTDLRRRPEGVRIKHRAGKNSIKMYDKQGSVLRVETTLNDAGPFKSFRTSQPRSSADRQQQASSTEEPSKPKKAWHPLRKGVVDLKRRAQVCQGANGRYLEAMSKVHDTTALGKLIAPLCQPTSHAGRRVRAFNPLGEADRQLLAAVNRGEFVLQGFRNKEIRAILFTTEARDEKEQRKQSSAVYRRLRVLLGHGLIYKIPKTHRYQLTEAGRTSITALMHAQQADTAQLLTLAA